ncbi:Cof-type HAD-IIB family hydrolase [Latilactobacillus sakei]|uniref:Cof-type HAD-IIB family hydrolase n=1 Tax=Latilactobacillus sakei TaxID=1599 RepID=A0AAF0GRL0_LATSK|nr:Cof-type HAD-IIB family hydrolase [Latilactobacillus sakei]WGI19708.1 Cof-type HAD-IIB family hydrolase [Latilactobacillus sakei]
MALKLLAIDLDGTTLNSQGEISDVNKTHLQQVVASGVQLVVATGRSVHSASSFLEQMGVEEAYIVSLNGAAVFKWGDLTPLMTIKMPTVLVEQVVVSGDLQQVNTYFSTVLNSYILVRDESLLTMFAKNSELTTVETLADLGDDQSQVSKMLYCTKNPAILAELVAKIKDLPVAAVKPDEMCLEITAQDTSKAKGLQFLGEILNILPEEMAAIGDSENDFEMLQFVGNGIVMANGMPHIKAIADYITLSNDQDGLAHAIRYLLE